MFEILWNNHFYSDAMYNALKDKLCDRNCTIVQFRFNILFANALLDAFCISLSPSLTLLLRLAKLNRFHSIEIGIDDNQRSTSPFFPCP